MKTIFAVCVVFASLFFSFDNRVSAEKSDKLIRSSRPIADRYIVVLEEQSGELALADVEASARDLSAGYSGRIEKVYSSAVKGYSVEMSPGEAERLSRDPRVKYVEEDSFAEPQDVVTSPGWALDRIDQRSLPYDNQYIYPTAGAGVNVYILDSGILTTHQALTGRAFTAVETTYDPGPIETCNGHGTGVAGVVASSNFGVARMANVHSVRVLPCAGSGLVSDVIAGVDWVTRNAMLPAVANMSLRTTNSKTLNNAVTASIRSGVTYVVAAGNDSADACNYSPGSVRDAIVVGATNSTDTRLTYSNFGSCVTVFAPGEGVSTIWNGSTTETTFASGTSFASPYVAGVAALYLSDHPNATPAEVRLAITSTSTNGAVLDVGAGSPNRLLYSRFAVNEPGTCSGDTFSGTLSTPGAMAYQSGADGFSAGTGDFTGTLNSPAGAAFTIALEKKAKSRWSVVASSSGATVSYRGHSGMYRWRIASVTGSGDYSVCSSTP